MIISSSPSCSGTILFAQSPPCLVVVATVARRVCSLHSYGCSPYLSPWRCFWNLNPALSLSCLGLYLWSRLQLQCLCWCYVLVATLVLLLACVPAARRVLPVICSCWCFLMAKPAFGCLCTDVAVRIHSGSFRPGRNFLVRHSCCGRFLHTAEDIILPRVPCCPGTVPLLP